jgi:uncharacterized protein YdgA (DUF945 family)
MNFPFMHQDDVNMRYFHGPCDVHLNEEGTKMLAKKLSNLMSHAFCSSSRKNKKSRQRKKAREAIERHVEELLQGSNWVCSG